MTAAIMPMPAGRREVIMDAFPQISLIERPDLRSACHEPGDDGAVTSRRLRNAGLRPTRQRVLLGDLLFGRGDRHVTAEMLFAEAAGANIQLSLATVYNTLNQFTQAGLLRRIGPDGSRSFFDTNTTVHPHFYLHGEDVLVDVPETLLLEQMPEPLPGHEISRLDIIIHIRRKPAGI
ncbi:Fur family transcriptional regulator Irr [Bradyrhizobium sp.]|uniref:Fur family transcriptional regulator Irr n=1 Tax=Bradyrhizobium sp. TaxID=376 RepID=UPI002DDD377E|nr:Fur family transcriptional regulator [Bradyrhizobium sp.]HEV2157752.1 Fur family transcriptional regulator [Bradyrhizobium sp.]